MEIIKAAELTLKLIERRDEVISILTHSVYTQKVKAYIDILRSEMNKGIDNPLIALLEYKKSGEYDKLTDISKALFQCAALEIIESI